LSPLLTFVGLEENVVDIFLVFMKPVASLQFQMRFPLDFTQYNHNIP